MKIVGPGTPSIDEMHLLAVASVHGRPQGEIIQTIHAWVVPRRQLNDEWYKEVCFLLTREKV